MDNEKLIFQYPIETERETFSEQYTNKSFSSVKTRIILIIISLVGIICFVVSSICTGNTLQNIFTVSAIILFIIAFFIMKSFNRTMSHYTMISAYETYMTLNIFKSDDNISTKIDLKYTDIIMCTISKNYDKATIFYKYNTSKQPEILKNSITFDINPNSFEQYFFLYVANKLFNVNSFYKKEWKLFKKFGTQNEYYTKLTT